MAHDKATMKSVTVKMTTEEYEVLRLIASRHKTTVPGLVRELAQELIEDLKDHLDRAEE